MKLVCVGECTYDQYLDSGFARVGGISLNFAVHARRSGAEQVGLVSCVGDDEGGHAARAVCQREGVDVSHIAWAPGATARQDIRMAAGGERIFPPGGYHPGVLAGWSLTPGDLAYIAGHEVLAVPVFAQIDHIVQAALHAPGFRGVRVADLLDGSDLGSALSAFERYAGLVDIAFVSADEQVAEALRPRSRESRTLFVVTHGAAGSTALVNGEIVRQSAVAVHNPVDTTGCGDAFQAAFTVQYVRTGDVAAALRAGAERAALVLQHYGAVG